eukprot:Hpha_TRINITY_DN13001_c0_g1::TRINITY_DN13001_c0_g1_i1::g.68944::m.68944
MAPSSGHKKPVHTSSSSVDFAGEGSANLPGGSTKAQLHQPVHLGLASAVNAAASGSVDGGGGAKGRRDNYKQIMPGLSVAGDSGPQASRPAAHGGGGGGRRVFHERRGPMRLSDLPEPSLNRGVSDDAVDWGVLDHGRRHHQKNTKLGLGIGAGKAVDAVGNLGKGLVSGIGGLFGGGGGGASHHHK